MEYSVSMNAMASMSNSDTNHNPIMHNYCIDDKKTDMCRYKIFLNKLCLNAIDDFCTVKVT